MEKERQEALEWFVDFVNVNLEAIKPGDKAKLLVESEEYLFPRREIEPFSSIREELVNKMPWVFNRPRKESKKYWDKLINLQDAVKSVFCGVSEHPYPVKGVQTLPWSITFIRTETIIKMERGQGKEPFRLFYLQVFKDQREYLWLKIDGLLKGLPAHTVQACPECKKYFVNASLRKKVFCSPRCLWRFNATKRRDADREGYRKYHREYMKRVGRNNARWEPLKTRSRKGKKRITRGIL